MTREKIEIREGFQYTRVLAMPKSKDKGERRLTGRHRQSRNWPEPADAKAVFNLSFKVQSFARQQFFAEAQLELPMSDVETQYQAFSASGSTKYMALRSVVEQIERSEGFLRLKKRKGVYFKVFGAGMDTLYKGYL